MKVVPPTPVTDAVLISSSIVEADYPEWSAGTTYAKGARVIRAATHRVYESVVAANVGNNPAAGSSVAWINIGPTNVWAMFDQAVGSLSTRDGSITVVLSPDQPVDALAVLDIVAGTVRVQVSAGGVDRYDQTQAGAGGATLTFLDLPALAGAQITMTATGAGSVSIGTLIIGSQIDLGTTETTPSIGITDFSRRDTDDYGVTTVVERSWAKRMSLKTQIDTVDVDQVQRKLAGVRAKACLWIGEEGFDSLAIYGFFKDFSIDLALPAKSYCTFTIEGLTTAGALDNPLAAVIADVAAVGEAQAEETLRAAVYRSETDAILTNADGTTIRTTVDRIETDGDAAKAFIADLRSVGTDGSVKAIRTLNSRGYVSGNYSLNDGAIAKEYVIADQWGVIDPARANDANAEATSLFYFKDGKLHVREAVIEVLDRDVVSAENVVANSLFKMESASAGSTFAGSGSAPSTTQNSVISYTLVLDRAAEVNIAMTGGMTYSGEADFGADVEINGVGTGITAYGGSGYPIPSFSDNDTLDLGPGSYTVRYRWRGSAGVTLLRARLVFLVAYNKGGG